MSQQLKSDKSEPDRFQLAVARKILRRLDNAGFIKTDENLLDILDIIAEELYDAAVVENER